MRHVQANEAIPEGEQGWCGEVRRQSSDHPLITGSSSRPLNSLQPALDQNLQPETHYSDNRENAVTTVPDELAMSDLPLARQISLPDVHLPEAETGVVIYGSQRARRPTVRRACSRRLHSRRRLYGVTSLAGVKFTGGR